MKQVLSNGNTGIPNCYGIPERRISFPKVRAERRGPLALKRPHGRGHRYAALSLTVAFAL